jgi:hypothetical protein
MAAIKNKIAENLKGVHHPLQTVQKHFPGIIKGSEPLDFCSGFGGTYGETDEIQ